MSAIKKKVVKRAKKLIAWKSIDHAVYSEVIQHLVHFSSRPVNTNATPVGVRLNRKRLTLPYLSVSTAGSKVIQTDYLRNGGSEAAPYKQIRAVLEDRLVEFDGVDAKDVKHIQSTIGNESEFEFRTDNIDPRLTQILWPLADGEYVALTPLPSAGLSLAINGEVRKWNDLAVEQDKSERKRPRFYRRSTLGIGGANSQNAGGLVYAMTTPLVFSAPTENPAVRRAVATYYKGVNFHYPKTHLNEYGFWLHARRNKKAPKNDLRSRNHARRLIQRIVKSVLTRADSARTVIAEMTDLEGNCSPDLPQIQQGLLNPELRNSSWCSAMASDLAHVVGKHKFRVAGEPDWVSVALDDTEVGAIAKYIEEMIR